MKNVIKMLLVIIATLVGAGFASGKEIFSFFFIYGKEGILGIFLSSFIISFVIYKVLKICDDNNVNTYQEFCNILTGNSKNNKTKFTTLLNNIVNIFLIITYYIMISGFSSFLKQEFNLNEIIGSIIIVSLCYIIFLKNIKGLIQVSNYLIPILIIFFIIISMKNINIVHNYNNIHTNVLTANIPKYKGIIKSVLYACYNCIILIPVLIPLRKLIKNKTNIIFVSIINFITFIILSFAIYNILLQGNIEIFNLEMPIIEIVKKYGKFYEYAYIIMIGVSIFTTAVSTGCGFLNNCSATQKIFKRNLVIMCISSILFSQISFSVLVNLLYPILGIIGLFEIVMISRQKLIEK